MLPALAALVAVWAAAAAVRRRRAIEAAPSAAAKDLVRRLRALNEADRIGALRTSILPGADTWEGRLALAISQAPDERERVDAASEAVSTLGAIYTKGAAWGSSGVRILLLVGLLLGAVGIARGSHLEAVAAFLIAAFGAAASRGLLTSASTLERRQRELADAVVEVLVPGAPPGSRPRPRPRAS